MYNNVSSKLGIFMVELIVLGLVPGTSFQITVTHVLVVSWVLFAVSIRANSGAKNGDNKPSIIKRSFKNAR